MRMVAIDRTMPAAAADHPQISLFESDEQRLRGVLLRTDPDELSPKAALELVYELRRLIDTGAS